MVLFNKIQKINSFKIILTYFSYIAYCIKKLHMDDCQTNSKQFYKKTRKLNSFILLTYFMLKFFLILLNLRINDKNIFQSL